MANQTKQMIPTPYGDVAVYISKGSPSLGSSPSLLLLHGNSSCSLAFEHILSSPPRGVEQVIAMDYLGHGSSANAHTDLDRAYTQRGYAEAAVSVLSKLNVTDVMVVGWSLGGHVAIELVDLLRRSRDPSGPSLSLIRSLDSLTAAAASIRCRGYMITGTPPANGNEQVNRGFDVTGTGQVPEKPKEEGKEGEPNGADLAATEVWSDDIAEAMAHGGHGLPVRPWMVEMAKRTDGRARRIMFASFRAGTGVDQIGVVESNSDSVCAVVNGANEPFVSLDYLNALKYANLWEGKCHRISGAGHAPFWEKPDVYAEYLQRFVDYCVAKG